MKFGQSTCAESFSTEIMSGNRYKNDVRATESQNWYFKFTGSLMESMITNKKKRNTERFEGHEKIYLSKKTMQDQLARKARMVTNEEKQKA